MIQGQCFTNIDDFKRHEWPRKFVAVPRVGEHVAAVGSVRGVLRVVAVTHCCDDERGIDPFVRVELHR